MSDGVKTATVGWVAVKGLSRQAVLDKLNLVEIGEASDWEMGDLACAETTEGWLVVVARKSSQLNPPSAAKALSEHHPALGGEVKVSALQSRSFGYEGGVEIWRLEHDPRIEVDGVIALGTPPEAFHQVQLDVRALASKEEDTVDWFYQVPPEVSLKVCGFRPEPPTARSWTLLARRTQRPRRPRHHLRAAMQAELTPFLLEQGWATSQRPCNPGDISEFEVQRIVGTYSHYLIFDYLTVPAPRILCRIAVWDDAGPIPRMVLQGQAMCPSARPSALQRLISIILRKPDNEPVGTAIQQAKAAFAIAQAYLDTGVTSKGLDVALMRGVKSWPEALRSP